MHLHWKLQYFGSVVRSESVAGGPGIWFNLLLLKGICSLSGEPLAKSILTARRKRAEKSRLMPAFPELHADGTKFTWLPESSALRF